MASAFKNFLVVIVGTVLFGTTAIIHTGGVRAAESHYQLVENWAQFPPGVTKWGAATGVDVDSHDNVYVLHRNESMPIMVFDRHGKFLRAWGQGMFKTTHFLRVDPSGYVWVTDRGDMQAFKFNSDGKLLMTLGKKGVTGDNTSQDTFNGMADLAVGEERRHLHSRRRRPQYACREIFQGWQVHQMVGRQRDRSGAVQRAAQHRDRFKGPRLRGRSLEQPHPDFRPGRQVSESVDQLRHAVGLIHQEAT